MIAARVSYMLRPVWVNSVKITFTYIYRAIVNLVKFDAVNAHFNLGA